MNVLGIKLGRGAGIEQLFMMLPENIFNEEQLFQKLELKAKEEEGYSPWAEEFQNFLKVPAKKESHRKVNSSRRYTSQLQSYADKSKEMMRANRKRQSILSEKYVSIQYDTNFPSNFNNKDRLPTTKIKLPLLSPLKVSRLASLKKEVITQERIDYNIHQINKSRRKYVPKIHVENPPHFQIYKRSLIAAHEYFKGNIRKPERSLQLYRNI